MSIRFLNRCLWPWSGLIGLILGGSLVAETPKELPPTTNSLGMKFVSVPGTAVQFSVWETRRQDFQKFVEDTGRVATNGVYSLTTNRWQQVGATWQNPGFPQTDRHPVCGVSWEDAKAFCDWLSKKEGRTYRLPTDEEWSRAVGLPPEIGLTPKARSGKAEETYPWGGLMPPVIHGLPVGNYAGAEAAETDWPAGFRVIEGFRDPFDRTAPVASFDPNPIGLYDLGGNVWEWCEDEIEPGKDYRVLRGASWVDNLEAMINASNRHSTKPGVRNVAVGFRCVLVPSPDTKPPTSGTSP